LFEADLGQIRSFEMIRPRHFLPALHRARHNPLNNR
jgi:hypothetical protein